MADRHHNPLPPSSRLITTTTAHIPSKPSSRLIQQPPGPSTSTTQPPTASSVRRNLFQSQLTRRPPHHPSSSTSAETIHLHHNYFPSDDPYQDHPHSPPLPLPPSPSADIVPRNSLGEIELGDPPTPPLYDTDDDNNNHHPSPPSHHHAHPHQNPNDHQKAEQLAARNRLTEAVRQHQLHQNKLLMSIPGSNMGIGIGIGIGMMQPPLNSSQPEGKKTSFPNPLFSNSSSCSFLFLPDPPHCSDPFCCGSGGPSSFSFSSPNPKLVYYSRGDPFSSPSSPEYESDKKKGKGKMVADEDAEDDGQSFAKTKKFTETELVEEVKVSLRAKVAALAQDNWMFEPEELPKPH